MRYEVGNMDHAASLTLATCARLETVKAKTEFTFEHTKAASRHPSNEGTIASNSKSLAQAVRLSVGLTMYRVKGSRLHGSIGISTVQQRDITRAGLCEGTCGMVA